MKKSLQILLGSLIDYAGMFPPASLPLEKSLENYVRYRDSEDAWMLGRFICPAKSLEAARTWLAASQASALEVSVLLPGTTESEIISSLEQAAGSANGPYLRFGTFECRLPDRVEPGFLKTLARKLGDLGLRHPVYWEASLENWPSTWPPLWEASRKLNHECDAPLEVGFKIRCGGAEPSQIPSLDQLAKALVETRKQGLRFKATAGLHHPLSHPDPTSGVQVHGFLNLFGAGVLADAHKLSETEIIPILAEEDPEAFGFEEEAFKWRGLSADLEALKSGRQRLASFGSCSFDEPREDLENSNWFEQREKASSPEP